MHVYTGLLCKRYTGSFVRIEIDVSFAYIQGSFAYIQGSFAYIHIYIVNEDSGVV